MLRDANMEWDALLLRPGKPLLSISTTGAPANPGAVVPSIVTLLVMAGRGPDVNLMTPATEKSISSGVVSALTLVMAARSEPSPASARLETVYAVGVSRVSSDSRRGRKVDRVDLRTGVSLFIGAFLRM